MAAVRSAAPRARNFVVLALVALLVGIIGGQAFAGGPPSPVTGAEACGAPPPRITSLPYSQDNNTAGHTNDVGSICWGEDGGPLIDNLPGPDLFYSLNIGANPDINVTVSQPGWVGGPRLVQNGIENFFNAVVYLLPASCNALACDDTIYSFPSFQGIGAPVGIHIGKDVQPGLYFIGVDTADSPEGGAYHIEINGDLGALSQTSTTLTSDLNPSKVGQSVTFRAHVQADAQTPTGSVVFAINGTEGAPVGLVGGEAFFPTSFSSPSIFTVSARYVPDGIFTESSDTLTQTVNQWLTATTIATIPAGSFGTPVSFTANVVGTEPGAPVVNEGTVLFTVDGFGADSVSVVGGSATLADALLDGGPHTIVASFSGATAFANSASDPYSHTVNPVDPVLTLTPSAPSPVAYGTNVIFTANISSPHDPPTGDIQFFVDGSLVFTHAPDGLGNVAYDVDLGTSFGVGAHTITATYLGDTNFNTATASIPYSVSQIAPLADITASPVSPSTAGTPVTFTVHVTDSTTLVPTGAGNLHVGALTINGVLDGSAQFVVSVSPLAPGIHTVTAEYLGDTNFTGAAAGTVHEVNKIVSSVSVVATPDTSVYLEPILLKATVTGTTGAFGPPTGTVEFFDGALSLGTGTVNASGEATIPTALPVATHSNVTAKYSGDLQYTNATSAPITVLVNQAATTTSLVSSSNPSISGNPVSFTAHVAVTLPGGGVPDGSIVFTDGPTTVATIALNSNGDATFTTSDLSVGSHSIGAAYTGSPSYIASLADPVIQIVASTGVNIQLESSNNPAARAAPVTFTATVLAVGIAQSPTGNVTFTSDGTTIGTSPIDAAHEATLDISTLSAGSHVIVARYDGDTTFPAGPSASIIQHIGKSVTTTTLTSSLNPAGAADDVTFTATVTSPITGTITGKIVFRDGTSVIEVSPDLPAAAVATYTTKLTPGTHTITAVYSGDVEYAPSISDPIGQLVNVPVVDGGAPPADAGTDSGSSGPTEAGTVPPGFDASIPPNVNIDGGININIPAPDENCECRSVGAGSTGAAGQAGAALFAGLGLAIAFARRRNRNR